MARVPKAEFTPGATAARQDQTSVLELIWGNAGSLKERTGSAALVFASLRFGMRGALSLRLLKQIRV
jgi:hypothetical protein